MVFRFEGINNEGSTGYGLTEDFQVKETQREREREN